MLRVEEPAFRDVLFVLENCLRSTQCFRTVTWWSMSEGAGRGTDAKSASVRNLVESGPVRSVDDTAASTGAVGPLTLNEQIIST